MFSVLTRIRRSSICASGLRSTHQVCCTQIHQTGNPQVLRRSQNEQQRDQISLGLREALREKPSCRSFNEGSPTKRSSTSKTSKTKSRNGRRWGLPCRSLDPSSVTLSLKQPSFYCTLYYSSHSNFSLLLIMYVSIVLFIPSPRTRLGRDRVPKKHHPRFVTFCSLPL